MSLKTVLLHLQGGQFLRKMIAVTAFATLIAIGCVPRTAAAATLLPCDIYASAGTPCVAAHSTTRALFVGYNGPLYQVARASDGSTLNIGLLAQGGYANAAAQDNFCINTTCIITRIFDQTSRHNDLTIEGAGGNGAADVGSPANALPITAGGHQVYGLLISAGMGYRNDATSGVAVNGQPEGMYMVTSGTHVNSGCCFDYGNAEVNNRDNGNAHMDAINFSTLCWFPPCNGSGPWVQADLENGLFASNVGHPINPSYTGNTTPYVTVVLKNNGQNFFELRSGDATQGNLITVFSGGEPTGYSPMHQEGAILLGTGGDDSNASIGSFFEGVMTAGVPADAADDQVQANIVTVGYGGPTGSIGTLTPGAEISLQATTAGFTNFYLRHQASGSTQAVVISQISTANSASDKGDATWIVRRGFANSNCISFESRNHPGEFIRHFNFHLFSQPHDGSAVFNSDATFCAVNGNSGSGNSFQSVNFPTKFIRHFNSQGFIASDGGSNAWDTATLWTNDTTWAVVTPWSP
jgi:non-reducing end alpha-L-arabinofuranosidase